MSASEGESFVVYEGKRRRDPDHVLRVTDDDGRAVHVFRECALRARAETATGELLPLDVAITRALRLAGRTPPGGCG